MSQCQIRGAWSETKGRVKQAWSDLTDDDLATIDGNRDRLIGAIQKRYGITRDAAQRQVDSWIGAL